MKQQKRILKPLSAIKSIKINYVIIAFFLPFVALCINLLVRDSIPLGSSSMLYSDCYHQYFPFFKDLRRAILSGDGILYTWSIGMGMDYLGLIAYYLGSPLNLLSLLMPESWVIHYFALLVPIKLSLASMFFAIFLKKLFGKNDFSIVTFGVFYGLCAWALAYQWNIMWLDTFALLPLVALGTISLLRDKKFILFTVTLFLSVVSNYYIGFFTCIFVLLLFICYQISYFSGWKRLLSDLCRIAFFSILALGMTAYLTLPAYSALQSTVSSFNVFPDKFYLYNADEHNFIGLLKAMYKCATNMAGGLKPSFKEGLPNIYSGVGILVLAVLYLFSKEFRLRERLCALFLLLFFLASFNIRQLDYIWHGFHFTNMIPHRFSFLYSFVMLYMAYRAYLNRFQYKIWHFLIAWVIAAVFIVGTESRDAQSVQLFNAVCMFLYLLGLIVCTIRIAPPQKASKRKMELHQRRILQHQRLATAALAAIMIMEMGLNIYNWSLKFPSTNISNYPKGTENTMSAVNYMNEREKNTPFFRAEVSHTQTFNDGALIGYHGITTFTSSANYQATEFMSALGFGAKNTYNRYAFEESSPVSNLFIGIKYMIERDKVKSNAYFDEIYTFGNVTLLENNAYLPLGFLVEPALADLEFPSNNGDFAFQNQLLTAASGVTENVWYTLAGSALTITSTDTTVSNSNGSGYCSYNTGDKKGTVSYTYIADRAGLLCIDLDFPKRNSFSVHVNDAELFTETYSIPQMLSVCNVVPGDKVELRINCSKNTNGTLTVQTAILNDEVFRQAYDKFSASTWELTSFASTHLEGTISCDRDGLLYTSIPQNGKWVVEVDGQEVDTIVIGDVMTAVELTAGDHTVSFTYRNTALTYGIIIALVCAAAFIAAYVIVYKPKFLSKGKYQK